MSSGRSRWLPAAVTVAVIGATLLLFGRVIGFGFVLWDDPAHVLDNPNLRPPRLAGLIALWRAPYEGLYVPLTYTIWSALAALSGAAPDPHLFHAAGLALHALAAVLVFGLVRAALAEFAPELRPDTRVIGAGAGALLFALHPVQVEAVAWVSGLRDVLSGTLGLLAIRLAGETRRGAALGAFAATALAILAKPAAVVMPLLALWVLVAWRRWPGGPAARRALPALALAVPAVLVARAAQHAVPEGAATPLLLRLPVALDGLAFYLGALVWPAGLAADQGRTTARLLAEGTLAWTWMIPVALAAAAILAARRGRPALLGALGFFALALAPESGLLSFAFQAISNVADRFAYLPMAGASFALGVAVARGGGLVRAGAAASLAAAGMVSVGLVDTWSSDQALFRRILEVNPRSAAALNNLGKLAQENGDAEAAVHWFERALENAPDHFAAETNLGAALYASGRYAEAVQHLERVASARPNAPEVQLNLGAALVLAGRYDEGVAHYQRALELDPSYADAYNNLGSVHLAFGRYREAKEMFERALALKPGDAGYLRGLERAEQGLAGRPP